MIVDRKNHWNSIYSARAPDELGWYQAHPETSLHLIAASGAGKDDALIDIGGGASLLVDKLVEAEYARVTVLDLSAAAIAAAQNRLGEKSQRVHWLTRDVRAFVAPEQYTVWHDRAVFHFFTEVGDRQAYLDAALAALAPDGQMIISTFAPDGPEKCSNLPVVRYDAVSLTKEVGEQFELLDTGNETHTTPGGAKQRFVWCRFRRR